ncbi:thiolase C-terminal domain-containing protein [Streptomyces sp. WG-D5]
MSAAIVGVHEHPLRSAPGHTPLRFAAESAAAALADSGLQKEDIDGLAVSGDAMAANFVSEYLDLKPRWFDSTSIGGSSFLSHIIHAADAIERGSVRAVLIVYGSVARSGGAAFGLAGREPAPDPMGVEALESLFTPYGVPLAAQYGMVASAHMDRFGTTREQLAEISVAMRAHAGRNPNALYRDPITVDDVLTAPMICSPLGRLDCCVISDGGGAVIVAHPDLVAPGVTPVWVRGGSEAVAHGEGGQRMALDLAAAQSGPAALERAGVSADDIDLLMVYDSFTITVLTSIEGIGFCKPGEGGDFVSGGALGAGGRLPTNTDGGALSSNHPGRRGLFLAIEAVRQLRGDAVNQQPDIDTALCHGTGGYLSGRHSGVSLVLGVDR